MSEGPPQTYFQKGFNLKKVVAPVLAPSYDSSVVDRLKELDYVARAGDVKVKLAREFGFCYGVDRAVEYAYETREKFPDRRIFLSGEIIHNPEVNGRIEKLGIRILPDHRSPEERYADVDAADVVILPAFGVSVAELEHLRSKGCVLVDTTCGSVLNVWKNVRRYAGTASPRSSTASTTTRRPRPPPPRPTPGGTTSACATGRRPRRCAASSGARSRPSTCSSASPRP